MNTLRDYVNFRLTHADKVAEAEGYPLKMENCKKYKKMRDLKVYGNSFQDGTPTPDAPVVVVSVGDKSVNLFDKDNTNSSVGYLINTGSQGDNVMWRTTDYIPVNGNTFTLSGVQSGANPSLCAYDSDKKFITGVAYKSSKKVTITAENIRYIRFSYSVSDTVVWDLSVVQLQEGSTATPYEPYGKYKIPVVQRGINLFSMAKCNATTTTINGITYTPLDDERIHVKGKLEDVTKNSYYQPGMKIGIPIKAGQYRAKYNDYSWNGLSLLYQIRKDGNFLVNINTVSGVVNVPEDGYIGSLLIGVAAGSTREWDDIIELQLMEGNQNLPYEPYVEPVTTNIFLDEPLRKIGDYADYIDFKDNKVVRNIGAKRLLSSNTQLSLGVSVWQREAHTDFFALNLLKEFNAADSSTCKSNRFKKGWWTWSGATLPINMMIIGGAGIGSMHFIIQNIYLDGITDDSTDDEKLNAFKSFLDNNNTYVYCIRGTSTEEPLNIDLPKLTAKTSIIEVDTSLAPSNAYGKYIKK